MKKREHEFHLQRDEMSTKVLEYELKVIFVLAVIKY